MTSFRNQDIIKNMIFPINTTTRFIKALVFTVQWECIWLLCLLCIQLPWLLTYTESNLVSCCHATTSWCRRVLHLFRWNSACDCASDLATPLIQTCVTSLTTATLHLAMCVKATFLLHIAPFNENGEFNTTVVHVYPLLNGLVYFSLLLLRWRRFE